jgi:tetratricopeptide (TPR) repeat protein
MEDKIQLGILYVKEGNYREGFPLLKSAMEKFSGKKPKEIPPALLSYYGLCTALLHNNVKGGLEHCQAALKQEFFQPDLYLNLGKVYLKANRKAGAVDAFYNGLKLDDDHKGILGELKRLGIRKSPFIRFLPRGHFLNRVLGQIRYRAESKNSIKV